MVEVHEEQNPFLVAAITWANLLPAEMQNEIGSGTQRDEPSLPSHNQQRGFETLETVLFFQANGKHPMDAY